MVQHIPTPSTRAAMVPSAIAWLVAFFVFCASMFAMEAIVSSIVRWSLESCALLPTLRLRRNESVVWPPAVAVFWPVSS